MQKLLYVMAVSAMGLSVSVAGAQAETWRMAHKMPPDSAEGVLFQKFADLVGEYSKGELTIKVFPAEQLGGTEAILEQLQIGTVHIYPEGGSYLQKWVPDIKWQSAPFLFDDREHWSRFMKTDLAKQWDATIEKEAGIKVLGDQAAFVRGPYRVMVSKKPVKGLEDVQGLKLRMHPDELAAAAWNHLGTEVRTLGWTEVYESIDRGIVDAVNSPVALVEPMAFTEVAPHITRHDEYPQGIAFMMNAEAFNGLDEELRQVLLRAYGEIAAESGPAMAAIAEESLEKLQEKGATYTVIDRAPFVAKMKSFYEEMNAKGEMPEGFLEAIEESRAGS